MEYAEGFARDVAGIWSPSVECHLRRVLTMLEAFALSGSTNVPASITAEFGPCVRKCTVNPFDLVYEYDAQSDTVFVYGLVRQRMAK